MFFRDMVLLIFALVFLFLHLVTLVCIFILNTRQEIEYIDPYDHYNAYDPY